MSLRTRLIITISAIVLIVVSTLSIGTFIIVSRQLQHETDHTLDARVQLISAQLQENRALAPFGLRQRNPLGDALLPTRFDTVTQLINEQGEVVMGIGDVDLPVDSGDIAIANGSQTGVHRSSVHINDTPYRMLTVPVSGGGALQLAKDTGDIEAAKRGILRWIISLGALGIILAAGAGYILARRISRPIRQLAETAEQIAVTRELSMPLNIKGDSEVTTLATSFNSMLNALGTSMSQQRQLVQDASHELRTPLTSLRANTELLERPELDEATRLSILRDMRAEVDELASLSAELSALASDQRLNELPSLINLTEIAEEVAMRVRRRTGRTINVMSDQPALVIARAAQFDRALSNLVDNAVKFDTSDQAVDISIHEKRIQVIDHGSGVNDEDKPLVFDRFYRANSTRALPGSGLGLAIVAQFAADHDATTFVIDTPGGGATVGIQFL
ncbi:MAG: HAMP domain-containing sensor histidine kinase [Ilumatobacteraceae bacterium]